MNTLPAREKTGILSSEAHVWMISPESVRDPAILQYCRDTLSQDERDRVDRFFRPEDSHSYLISHAMVRSVLSRYADITPGDWKFSEGIHGRPEIDSDQQTSLRFNLTHTNGLAACIVTCDDPCGIDAEQVNARNNPIGVAERMFSAKELEQLKQYEGDAFLEYFYERWTLREAYVKARGIGISFPTHQLCFDIMQDNVTVEFDSDIDDREEDWNFRLIRPDSGHIVALALHDCTGIKKQVRINHFSFTD